MRLILARYGRNWEVLRRGMEEAGFRCLVPRDSSAHIITAFLYPPHNNFNFEQFYTKLSEKGRFK